MLKSVKAKLFLTICLIVTITILFLVIVNNVFLEKYYYYKKQKSALEAYNFVSSNLDKNLESDLDRMCLRNEYDIIISNGNENIYASNKNFLDDFDEFTKIKSKIKYSVFNQSDILYSDGNVNIRIMQDKKHGISFMMLYASLEDGSTIYLRSSLSSITDSITASTQFFISVAAIAIFVAGIIILVVTDRFTKPIKQLEQIAKNISKLDFSKKYEVIGNDDEIDSLGESINELSLELEEIILKMQKNNRELERDIEHKSKIDEMRKQFISDVSHELKTPISLIQGYAEGLVENVNTDEDSKNFYAEVILDEANKMDKLVKRLLELIKLEYEETSFNDTNFDVVEVINEVIRIQKVKLSENNVEVIFDEVDPTYVFADDFYIEQVFSNYFTNAMKNVEEINGKKQIKITVSKAEEQGKVRISVYNTGKHIAEENLDRIWNRFFKVDESRDRSKGGNGIGLSLVKAIMNKYNNKYGVLNVPNGVEFYFELNYSRISID